MRGPRYLSIIADDVVIVCDDSYPNHYLYPLVFDLNTGALVSWASLMGNPVGPPDASRCSDSCINDTIDSPMLDEMSKAAAVDECKRVFDSAHGYQVWPDAKKGQLAALATGLPHVTQGCAEKLFLTADQARKLGFDERLLTAIDQAHRDWTARSHGDGN